MGLGLIILLKLVLFVLPFFPWIFFLWLRRGLTDGRRYVESPRRICIIRLDEIGDFVLFTPFLRALRNTFPQAEITLVVNPVVMGIASSCTFVDRLEVFDAKRRGIFWPLALPVRSYLFPKRKYFDWAINGRFDSDFRYAASWIVAGTGAPVRLGWSVSAGRRPAILDAGKDLLYSSVFKVAPIHELDKALALASYVGCNVEGERAVPELQAGAGIRSALPERKSSRKEIRLMLFPGGSYANKKWSLDRYISVLREISLTYPLQVILVGGPSEKGDAEILKSSLPEAIDLCGEISLQELYATATHCDIYLGSDSGPAHLAAASGMCALVLFRSPASLPPDHQHSVQRFLPRGEGAIEFCQPAIPTLPCTETCQSSRPHCILQISEFAVFAKLEKIIEQHCDD